MELLTIIQPIVLAIIAGLFSIRILPLFTGKRMKKINNAKLIIDLLGDENSLHKGFLMDEIKEASFYQYSKISTNASITKQTSKPLSIDPFKGCLIYHNTYSFSCEFGTFQLNYANYAENRCRNEIT